MSIVGFLSCSSFLTESGVAATVELVFFARCLDSVRSHACRVSDHSLAIHRLEKENCFKAGILGPSKHSKWKWSQVLVTPSAENAQTISKIYADDKSNAEQSGIFAQGSSWSSIFPAECKILSNI